MFLSDLKSFKNILEFQTRHGPIRSESNKCVIGLVIIIQQYTDILTHAYWQKSYGNSWSTAVQWTLPEESQQKRWLCVQTAGRWDGKCPAVCLLTTVGWLGQSIISIWKYVFYANQLSGNTSHRRSVSTVFSTSNQIWFSKPFLTFSRPPALKTGNMSLVPAVISP